MHYPDAYHGFNKNGNDMIDWPEFKDLYMRYENASQNASSPPFICANEGSDCKCNGMVIYSRYRKDGNIHPDVLRKDGKFAEMHADGHI